MLGDCRPLGDLWEIRSGDYVPFSVKPISIIPESFRILFPQVQSDLEEEDRKRERRSRRRRRQSEKTMRKIMIDRTH